MMYVTSFHCNMEKQKRDLLYLLQFIVQYLSFQVSIIIDLSYIISNQLIL